MPDKLLMTVMHGDQLVQQHSFGASSVMLGRSAPCTVLLNDPAVSRVHAEISFEHGAWYLNDLGSANGTLLNGTCHERTVLASGDVIELGSFRIHVTIASAAPSEAAASPASVAGDRTIRAPAGKQRP